MTAPQPVPLRLTRALATAAALLCPALLLRAESDGPAPGLLPVLLVGAVLAALVWPLTTRTLGAVRAPAGALMAQLLLHAGLLWAATGSPVHPGALGSLCSPSVLSPTGSSLTGFSLAGASLTGHSLAGCGLGAVTATGGLPLLMAQLASAGLVGLLLARADAALLRCLVDLPRLSVGRLLAPALRSARLLARTTAPTSGPCAPSVDRPELLPPRLAAVPPPVRRGPPAGLVPAACA